MGLDAILRSARAHMRSAAAANSLAALMAASLFFAAP